MQRVDGGEDFAEIERTIAVHDPSQGVGFPVAGGDVLGGHLLKPGVAKGSRVLLDVQRVDGVIKQGKLSPPIVHDEITNHQRSAGLQDPEQLPNGSRLVRDVHECLDRVRVAERGIAERK